MTRSYYHGTSADNLKNILENGFDPYSEKLWGPSENGVYFWSPDVLAENGDCDEEYKQEYAQERAYDSAQIAITKATDCRCIVFRVELDEDEVESDQSCENMEGAVVIYKKVEVLSIKEVFISPDLSMLKGYFIAIARGLHHCSLEFSDFENKIADLFENNKDFYIEMEEFALLDYAREPFGLSVK